MFARRAHAAQRVSCRGGCDVHRTSVSASPGARIRAGPCWPADGAEYRRRGSVPAYFSRSSQRAPSVQRIARTGMPVCPGSHSPSRLLVLEPRLAAIAGGVRLATIARVRAISRGSDLGSRMGEFAATLQDRLREAHASLLAARAAGDADLTDTQLDEIAHLREIAVAHGIPEPASA